jgi:hypothetical protein
MHYKLGHHPMGGKFFRNHINFALESGHVQCKL